MSVAETDWPLYQPSLTRAERLTYDSIARRCARGVRGCSTDEQYTDLVERIVEALAFATGKIERKLCDGPGLGTDDAGD
jgi:hypothetical protein